MTGEAVNGRPITATGWADTRTLCIDTSESRRARRFHQILDEEYLKVIAPGPSPAPPTQ
ncbi:hypothetical protein ACRYCC_38525 [Actinomadura scrupuli]|uniref:hypothetical protein n=1 Tax=Actinomadura scrupuli TaxID=559629 RepID=UPI003D97C668